MENYIMLNGKRIDLTAEQIETLVGKKEKDPFERVGNGEKYFYISWDGEVEEDYEEDIEYDNALFNVANYCTDKEIMKQRALHETLNRLLWRYSMQNGGRDLDMFSGAWVLYFCESGDKWKTIDNYDTKFEGSIYFADRATAEAAIEEIVIPFMEKHPEFRW